MGNRLGGTMHLRVNGESYSAKGNFEFGGGDERTGVAGADEVHGYTEKKTPFFIAGAITDKGDLDLELFWSFDNATVTIDHGNGRTIVLSDAWFAGPRKGSTEEGEIECRFEGKRMQFVEASA